MARRLVDIIYRDKGGYIKIPVSVIPTRDKMTNPTRVCPECDELGKISEIGKKDYCKEPSCFYNDVLPKEVEPLRMFSDDKLTIDSKERYTKEQIKNCKKFPSDIEILGKQMKPVDKTRIRDCHYVLPDTRKDENNGKYSMLYFGLKNSGHVLPIITGRTNAEKIGVLTVEKDFEIPVILLFTMVFTEEIHQDNAHTAKFSRHHLSSKIQDKKGRDFINSLVPFDLVEYESQTNKNYELLVDGKEEEII